MRFDALLMAAATQAGGAAAATGPAFVSATGYETGVVSIASWTPFTTLDLSNCDLAVFILARDGGNLGAGDTTASSGWVGQGSSVNASISANVFYKVDPTASETLAITFDAVGEQASGILVRVSGANTVTLTTFDTGDSTNANCPLLEEFDPVADVLVIAAAGWDNVITPSVAPSGYSNLTTQPASGALGASSAIATKLCLAISSEDPGAFTSDTEQWLAATIGCHQV